MRLARRDIEAGNNAGMKTYAATYGYIGDWENIHDWGATDIINHPRDIVKFI